jgi:hypothetical protein
MRSPGTFFDVDIRVTTQTLARHPAVAIQSSLWTSCCLLHNLGNEKHMFSSNRSQFKIVVGVVFSKYEFVWFVYCGGTNTVYLDAR